MTLFAACTEKDDILSAVGDHQGKAPIELSVGIVGSGVDATTRAVYTTDNPYPYGTSARAFKDATSLYMVMKSEKEEGSPLAVTGKKYTYTIGTVPATANPASSSEDNVTFGTGYFRYWDDAHSRDSKMTIYAACVPGQATALTIGGSSTYNSNTWTTVTPPTTAAPSTDIVWPLGRTAENKLEQNQSTTEFIAKQDLCFSNNLSKNTTDNRLCFNNSTKKFDTGKLCFYHALTKITFQIKKGSTFDSNDPFAFTNEDGNVNVELVGFNTSGTLNVSTGEWESVGTETIKKMAVTEDNRTGTAGSYGIAAGKTYAYVMDALLLPGSDLNSDAIDKINFHIDHNTYHITKNQLVEALKEGGELKELSDDTTPVLEDDTKMRRGVHYIFTLEVNKKGIGGITAAVVPWEEVEADEHVPTNVKVAVNLLNNGSAITLPFDLYRLVHVHTDIEHDRADYNWMTNAGGVGESDYTDAGNKVTISTGTSPYTTGWLWPNNKTFYHFRAVRPTTETVTKDAINGDYITITGAPYASYTDVLWGAPFTNIDVSGGDRIEYSAENGFDKKTGSAPDYTSSQIYKAIGPTEGTINLEMFHMMSDVTIQLTTTTGTDAVTLAGATIKMSNIYNSGLVRMGNGKVETTGSSTTLNGGLVDGDKKWHYCFVPQDLENVVLTITTTDGNQYEVTMKDMTSASYSSTNNLIANPYATGDHKINRWYPNMEYTYTFKLKKKGIDGISATIAVWENVNADPQEVTIK